MCTREGKERRRGEKETERKCVAAGTTELPEKTSSQQLTHGDE